MSGLSRALISHNFHRVFNTSSLLSRRKPTCTQVRFNSFTPFPQSFQQFGQPRRISSYCRRNRSAECRPSEAVESLCKMVISAVEMRKSPQDSLTLRTGSRRSECRAASEVHRFDLRTVQAWHAVYHCRSARNADYPCSRRNSEAGRQGRATIEYT